MDEIINLEVEDEEARIIDSYVKAGVYKNREEFIKEAIRKKIEESEKKKLS